LLLDGGAETHHTAKIDRASGDGTPLHFVAMRGDAASAHALLEASVDLEAPTLTGETPLHMSVRYGHVEVSSLLLMQGADMLIADCAGSTPREEAAQSSCEPMRQLFVDGTTRFRNWSARAGRMDLLNRLPEAMVMYQEALRAVTGCAPAPTKAQIVMLHYNRAFTAQRMQRFILAMAACSQAIELDAGHMDSYILRGECHAALREFKQAVDALETAANLGTLSSRHGALLTESRTMMNQKAHEILGVLPDAKIAVVKAAYKQLCLTWHPDKHSGDGSSDEQRRVCTNMFQRIGGAYLQIETVCP